MFERRIMAVFSRYEVAMPVLVLTFQLCRSFAFDVDVNFVGLLLPRYFLCRLETISVIW